LPAVTTIGSSVFTSCNKLTALILREQSKVCSLAGYNALSYSSIPTIGYIYVPSALVERYKVATNWSEFAARFRALEDYTVDGTTTGELDPSKI
jgi:hypothetical protein